MLTAATHQSRSVPKALAQQKQHNKIVAALLSTYLGAARLTTSTRHRRINLQNKRVPWISQGDTKYISLTDHL